MTLNADETIATLEGRKHRRSLILRAQGDTMPLMQQRTYADGRTTGWKQAMLLNREADREIRDLAELTPLSDSRAPFLGGADHL